MEIHVRNVNEALAVGIRTFMAGKESNANVLVAPRGQPTLEWHEPVLTIYERPTERVLFSPTRDANPFFHLFESLWMLAGRDDVLFVERLNKRMREFSDDGEKFYGAYGWRWRNFFGFDQLEDIVQLLQKDPDTRRAVLSIWSTNDLKFVNRSKDIPCNTTVYFKLRGNALRMTVMCRSNDMLWGAYGANAVHFSMLHEYIADKLGVGIGALHQLSDSFHVYTTGPGGELWDKVCNHVDVWELKSGDLYSQGLVRPLPLCALDPDWDVDLHNFFAAVDSGRQVSFKTHWFRSVVEPLWAAWQFRNVSAARDCAAEDWRTAAIEWLERRMG